MCCMVWVYTPITVFVWTTFRPLEWTHVGCFGLFIVRTGVLLMVKVDVSLLSLTSPIYLGYHFFSFTSRWRFTFYLCIFTYGFQFLWQVSTPSEQQNSSVVKLLCVFSYITSLPICWINTCYFLVPLAVGHTALLVRLPLSGTMQCWSLMSIQFTIQPHKLPPSLSSNVKNWTFIIAGLLYAVAWFCTIINWCTLEHT